MAQTIDASWLANAANQVTAHGQTAYVLKTANETYTLGQNVTCGGNGFYIANEGITLNLGGFTLTYNNANLTGASAQGEHHLGIHGIVIWRSNGASPEVSGGISGGAVAWNWVVKNGSIVNANAGNLSHGIYGSYALDGTVQEVDISTDGKDSHSIFITWANDVDTGAASRSKIPFSRPTLHPATTVTPAQPTSIRVLVARRPSNGVYCLAATRESSPVMAR